MDLDLKIKGFLLLLAGLIFLYILIAYVILPFLWRRYERSHSLVGLPKTAITKEGIPGDPLNIGLIGSEKEVIQAMIKANWISSDPVTLKTSVRIVESALLHREYSNAPISDLYLWGRRQDLAFEMPVGDSPKQRHHVRFWRAPVNVHDRVFWIGSVTFDESCGVSHLTGKITHHIASDVDKERDKLMSDLTKAGQIIECYQGRGVDPTLYGKNGGGDRYFTDGKITIGIVSPNNEVQN
ncbi:MAG: LssY C-terminal domain-containing protein [Deltaproteobacteria bacterium]|nr:LssY C-terminal domain-containing protein [Deltaproteobacteria bacterium]